MSTRRPTSMKGIILALVSGLLMGSFFPLVNKEGMPEIASADVLLTTRSGDLWVGCGAPMRGGLYRLNGPLTVPPGVTLCGASGGVPHSEHPSGSVLLAFGGRGQPEGEPLLTLKANAVVRNLTIHYPEQTLREVIPYPWSIRADILGT